MGLLIHLRQQWHLFGEKKPPLFTQVIVRFHPDSADRVLCLPYESRTDYWYYPAKNDGYCTQPHHLWRFTRKGELKSEPVDTPG